MLCDSCVLLQKTGKYGMSAEEGRKILGSLVTLVSELLEELVKSEHRDDIDVLEAREAGRCNKGKLSLFIFDIPQGRICCLS